jgi:superfamily I DNA and RNA helicase
LGRQIAAALADPSERILLVSTTNKATDQAALALGAAVLERDPGLLKDGELLRVGKGAKYARFADAHLLAMLEGTETEALRALGQLERQYEQTRMKTERALLRLRIKSQIQEMRDLSRFYFSSPNARVVVSTVFRAMSFLQSKPYLDCIAAGFAPFTTVVIDEAGLVSRAATAALSLLAARRVVLSGDSKQLAPISKIARVLPTQQSLWLAESGVSHLDHAENIAPAVHLLREQHRMTPQVSAAVSHYQYGGVLVDDNRVKQRPFQLPAILAEQPRALWYVLDEAVEDLPALRAERGPGNRSWQRRASEQVIERLFRDASFVAAQGLYITPFKAQARRMAKYFATANATSWTASTVHSQQGAEADLVIFDTVNAGSSSWSHDEWQRLVNVAMSRTRECFILLASRAEMQEPYLRTLVPHLARRVLSKSLRKGGWVEVELKGEPPAVAATTNSAHLLGTQLQKWHALRPVLSADQQRLCGYAMDGGPRLVRGVAGSGKTWVLALWLQKTILAWRSRLHGKIWAIYANQALKHLIADTIEAAWRSEMPEEPFPWNRVELLHIRDVLSRLLEETNQRLASDDFDYPAAARRYLAAVPVEQIEKRCHAMFIDEAQDFGEDVLKLLTALVKPNQRDNANSRAVNIFYDNAQNIYEQATPVWSELGLDMRGRSTVMKESFRSTKPINEFALNVLYRLQPPENDADHRELIERGLLEKTTRLGHAWWSVRFNQVQGPLPAVHRSESVEASHQALCDQVLRYVIEEGVSPSDICVIVHRDTTAQELLKLTKTIWQAAGIRLAYDKTKPVAGDAQTVVMCTSNSFKGYEAEIVMVAAVQDFVLEDFRNHANDRILSNKLYVALTRARSLLHVYGSNRQTVLDQQLFAALEHCQACLADEEQSCVDRSPLDDIEDLVQQLGEEHREWLETMWKKHRVRQHPVLGTNGKVLAEPLFWFEHDQFTWLCMEASEAAIFAQRNLDNLGLRVISPGEAIP